MSFGTIRDLTECLSQAEFTGGANERRRVIRGYSTDSRSLTKGQAFVALVGEAFDGHAFLEDVAARGASVAVVQRSWHASARRRAPKAVQGMPLVVVDDTLAAYGAVATAHRRRFAIPVIAVAGSNGKTTTKELIADLLTARYNVLRTEGNLNNLIGVPAMMLRMTADHGAAVIEIGTNTPGEIERLAAILEPTHGIITNIGREHLELLGSIDGVAEEEGALYRYLAATGGTAFVNQDDPYLARMGRAVPKRVTYGRRASANIVGLRGPLDDRGAPLVTITDRRAAQPKQFSVQLATPGVHTAQNAVAAAAVALALRVSQRDVRRGLERFAPIVYKGGYARLAPMAATNGARVLNDTYNANPDSLLAALVTLAAMKTARGGLRIAVLADMRELGRSSKREHTMIGEALAAMPKIGLAMFHGAEMKHAHRALLRSGAKTAMPPMYFERKEDLAEALQALLAPEDIVLVKGSRGMKMEDVVRSLVE